MSKTWVAVIAGIGGIFVGLAIADAYAKNTVAADIHTGLNKLGLGGGVIEQTADQLIVPNV